MIDGLFVTGTDTEIGKTAAACAIARWLRGKGRSVGVMKPVASGCRMHRGRLVSDDALRLTKAAGCDELPARVCPITFRAPLAPAVAAQLEHRRVDLPRAVRAFHLLARRYDYMVVEGVGGLAVPLTARRTVADLAKMLDLDLLIVARAGLGTLNHTALTVEYARRRGLTVRGVVLNRATGRDLSEKTNAAEIKRLTGVPVLGIVPEVTPMRAAQRLLDVFERSIDVAAIWRKRV